MLKILRHVQHPLDMAHAQLHALIDRQRLRRADTILDLAPIQHRLGEAIVVRLCELNSLDAVELTDALEEHDPDGLAGLVGEFGVAQGDVDAGLEGVVEGLDAVGGEEEDALEVFEQAQEDGDEGIAVDVLDGALFEEDVCFVEEEDGAPRDGIVSFGGRGRLEWKGKVPAVSDVEDFLELCFELARVGAQFACRDHVKWAFEEFGDGFGGQGLRCH